MLSLSQLRFHLHELGPQAVASGLPFKQEPPGATGAANKGEAQKVESLRFSKPALRPSDRREAAKLD